MNNSNCKCNLVTPTSKDDATTERVETSSHPNTYAIPGSSTLPAETRLSMDHTHREGKETPGTSTEDPTEQSDMDDSTVTEVSASVMPEESYKETMKEILIKAKHLSSLKQVPIRIVENDKRQIWMEAKSTCNGKWESIQ